MTVVTVVTLVTLVRVVTVVTVATVVKVATVVTKKSVTFFLFLFIALKIVTKLKNSLCDKNSKPQIMTKLENSNGNRIIADLRYGGKDIISPSTLNFAPIKG